MFSWWNNIEYKKNIEKIDRVVDSSFEYSSDKNTDWYNEKDLKEIIQRVL